MIALFDCNGGTLESVRPTEQKRHLNSRCPLESRAETGQVAAGDLSCSN